MSLHWSLPLASLIFVAAAAVTIAGSAKLASLADQLADRLPLGEALFGAVFLGAVTSLSGIVMTGTAAHDAHAGSAYGNAVGGIAAQNAIPPEQAFVTALSMLLTIIVLMGLVRRQTHGLAGIGWESTLLLVVYVGAMFLLTLTGHSGAAAS